MKHSPIVLLASAALSQTPIPISNPPFKVGTEYRQGSFVFAVRGKSPDLILTIGSTDRRVTRALVEVFYYAPFPATENSNGTRPFLSEKIWCPLVLLYESNPVAACDTLLKTPVDAIQMIRITGMQEVERVEVGKP